MVRVHVNRHVVASNRKHGQSEPPLVIRRGRKREYCATIDLVWPVRLMYRPEKPLDCGATVWIEAQDAINLDVAAPQQGAAST